ncbi:uncharacterized protein [Nicotiana tomentosiformis]|uniref:uncharacterized protein n=1 Tax=Nicotiana tomentosiformis TaxID=4098 RepID=UPI00051AB80A|nr:ycf49-like protein isoform X1 [Nicotiana tomentosiformis]
MAVATSLSLSKLHLLPKQKQTQLTLSTKAPNFLFFSRKRAQFPAPIISIPSQNLKYNAAIVLGVTGLAFTVLNVGPASGSELALMGSSFQFNEPSNALSLHTWASHVSSVVEWVTAMALVWQYGEKSGYESWKGLSWAMVPLLGGALCACTWHFFYNSESLEVVVALQAALTVIGNATMCFAAFRIYKLSQKQSKEL